jgi:high-affinity Fe2+/Pb2+ permease
MFAAIVNYVKMIANEYLMSWSAALPTFFITLREGVEAPLVVGIVFACLHIAGYI